MPYSSSARIGVEGRGPKLELCGSSENGAGGMVQKWNTKVRGRRDKGDPEVEQEVQKYPGARP